MAIDITVKKEINKPSLVVSKFIFNPLNEPLWTEGLTRVKPINDGEVVKGSQVLREGKFMGKNMENLMEVKELIPGKEMVLKTIQGELKVKITYKCEAVSNTKTSTSIRIQSRPEMYFGFPDFLVSLIVKRNMKQDLKKLKELLENKTEISIQE